MRLRRSSSYEVSLYIVGSSMSGIRASLDSPRFVSPWSLSLSISLS